MANLGKLKGRPNRLGVPPSLEEASTNLLAPEVAPAAPVAAGPAPVPPAAAPVVAASAPAPEPVAPQALPAPRKARTIDGRTLRRTNRYVQLNFKVTEEFDARLRALAQKQGILLVEVMERSLAVYEASLAGASKASKAGKTGR